MAGHDGAGAVQPGEGGHHALPLPGDSNPDSGGRPRDERSHEPRRDLWRARCLVTGTPGSGGGSGRPTRWKHRQGAPGRPHYYLLEAEGFTCWLLNAKHVKNVPGRPKTDKIDAVWLAKVVERGMCSPSLVHPKPIRQLRDLTRYRRSLIRERTREKQRVEKLLEDAQIKLSSVISDIFGVSGGRCSKR